VKIEETDVMQRDQILAEIEAFIGSIATGSPVAVTGEDGLRALETALLIEEKIRENTALLKAGA
jgi:predicted dehydrogenase